MIAVKIFFILLLMASLVIVFGLAITSVNILFNLYDEAHKKTDNNNSN